MTNAFVARAYLLGDQTCYRVNMIIEVDIIGGVLFGVFSRQLNYFEDGKVCGSSGAEMRIRGRRGL
jgi:hypothetical protein